MAERLDIKRTPAAARRPDRDIGRGDHLLLRVDATASSPELAQQIASVESDEIIRLVKNLETPSDEEIPAPIIARLAGKPSLESSPVSPDIPLYLAIGLLVSLLVGIVGALLRDLLDTSVKSSEDVEKLTGNALMATLPFDPVVKQQPLSIENGSGSLAEAFRVLRTNLQFSNLDATRQMIVVTSAVPDEGKTFVATNLAISIAKSGRSVLLDRRRLPQSRRRRSPRTRELSRRDHRAARARDARAGDPRTRERGQVPRHRSVPAESLRGARHPGHA